MLDIKLMKKNPTWRVCTWDLDVQQQPMHFVPNCLMSTYTVHCTGCITLSCPPTFWGLGACICMDRPVLVKLSGPKKALMQLEVKISWPPVASKGY